VATQQPRSEPSRLHNLGRTILQERVLKKSIDNNKLDRKQFGCLRGKSTTHALIDMLHHWNSALDNRKSVRLLFVDYAKAFNHVDNSTVVRKLINVGVHDILIR